MNKRPQAMPSQTQTESKTSTYSQINSMKCEMRRTLMTFDTCSSGVLN